MVDMLLSFAFYILLKKKSDYDTFININNMHLFSSTLGNMNIKEHLEG